MPNNKHIFVAAWEYPPIMSGESVVCRRTLEYSRYNYDLCCGCISDFDLGYTTNNGDVCIYPVAGNKYLQWPWMVTKKFCQLDAKRHYQVVMSRVMPPNGHLAGWLIKRRRPDIKWIVYFSDPIWNSPFLKLLWHKDKEQRPNLLLMKLFGVPAKWAIKEADLLIFNNERLARYVLGYNYEKYRQKIVIVPYGHEGVKPQPAMPRSDNRFCLTHVGQIYGNRTFRDLLAGVMLLCEQKPDVYERLLIRQVGFCCESEKERVANSLVSDRFEFIDTVPYENSIEEMYKAHCLLVIDPVFPKPEQNMYIPGKLFDYMSTGRPIMCIADRDSATGDVAAEIDCVWAEPNAEAVCRALQNVCQGVGALQNLDKFNCRLGVEKLDTAIDKLFN